MPKKPKSKTEKPKDFWLQVERDDTSNITVIDSAQGGLHLELTQRDRDSITTPLRIKCQSKDNCYKTEVTFYAEPSETRENPDGSKTLIFSTPY